ncbi:hypothetical protein IGI04_015606 [Brassica rapa subsp. trilocularis]|uniref:Uncharacterized protein n=1 Tax=Brassica rapa subsp. trilocularis TaxID=1813537 RepID=A0ABQ7MQI9_BRACM|nr:hypothetical protein IGI04_015606 [Brassica rapa subsp. trilocularis]
MFLTSSIHSNLDSSFIASFLSTGVDSDAIHRDPGSSPPPRGYRIHIYKAYRRVLVLQRLCKFFVLQILQDKTSRI